ncbi:MAG: SPOR domain-containing protein [Gammaproteobacteria bacterium]|nr:SPOR domain-containing protein [Gammaproteobacteria bacterium]
MPRDYKSRVMRDQKKSLPGYVWLLSGLAIGLFVAFIVYLDKQPESDKDFGSAIQQELSKLKQQAKKNINPKNDQVETEKEQKFNFYTILPELEVLIPESETRPPEGAAENKSKTNTGNQPDRNKQYVLQVASFQNLGDAEKLKANLAFIGISASIQHVNINNQTWHRVRTGPYKDKQQLYKNQKILKQNDIDAISMELKQ